MNPNNVTADSASIFFSPNINGSGGTSPITDALVGISFSNELSRAGTWSAQLPLTLWDPDVMAEDTYAFITLEFEQDSGGGIILQTFSIRGKIAKAEKGKDASGREAMTLSGPNILGDLAEGKIGEGEVFEYVTEKATHFSGQLWRPLHEEFWDTLGIRWWETLHFPLAHDGDAGTHETVILAQREDKPFPDFEHETEWERLKDEVVWLYLGNSAPFNRANFTFGTQVNSKGAVIRVQQYTKAGWERVAAGDVGNTTVTALDPDHPMPFSQNGYIEWPKLDIEQPLTHMGVFGYWVRFDVIMTEGEALDPVDIKEITLRVAGGHSEDVKYIMGTYAPSWDYSADGTQAGHQLSIRNQNVLNVLHTLAERSGESFAVGYGGAGSPPHLLWFPTPLSSSFVLKEAPEGGDTANVGYMTGFRRTIERRQLFTRIKVVGAGDDEGAAVSLLHLEAGAFASLLPTGYVVAGEWLINQTLEIALGKEVPEVKMYPDIIGLQGGTGPNRQAARELLKAGVAYLVRHSAPSEHFTAEVIGIISEDFHAGRIVRVKAPLRDEEGNLIENIDKDFVLVSVSGNINYDGKLRWSVTLGATAEHVPTAALANALKAVDDIKKRSHPQPSGATRLVGSAGVGTTGGGGGAGTGEAGVSLEVFEDHTSKTVGAHGIPTQIDTKIATHTALPNAHHNQSHVLATTSALGADHTVSGLTTGQVLKATGATTAAFGQLQHSQLGGITPSDHHAPVTVTAPLALSGQLVSLQYGQGLAMVSSQLRASLGDGLRFDGGNAIEVYLNANSGLSFFGTGPRWIAVNAGGGVAISGNAVTLSPASVGISSTNGTTGSLHSHEVQHTSDAHAVPNRLLSALEGYLKLRNLDVHLDLDVGQDLAVGRDAAVVGDLSVGDDLTVTDLATMGRATVTGALSADGNALRMTSGRLGINRDADPQFKLDINGAARANWWVGRTALMVDGVTIVTHMDGTPVGHMGQMPLNGDPDHAPNRPIPLVWERGRFGGGLAVYDEMVNLVKNPSREINSSPAGTNYGTDGTLTLTRTNEWSYSGSWSTKMSGYVSGNPNVYWIDTVSPLDVSTTYTWSAVVRRAGGGTVSAAQIRPQAVWGTGDTGVVADALYENLGGGAWRVTQTFTTGASAGTYFVIGLAVQAGFQSETWFFDSFTLVKQAFAPPTFDGDSRGCSWTGTPHASTSRYDGAYLDYSLKSPAIDIQGGYPEIINRIEGALFGYVKVGDLPGGLMRPLFALYDTADAVLLAVYLNGERKAEAKNKTLVLTDTAAVALNEWVQFGVTWKQDGDLVLYVNGIEVDRGLFEGFGSVGLGGAAVASEFWLGRYLEDGKPLAFLNGMLDEFFVVERELEPIEVRAIYESKAPIFTVRSTTPSGGVSENGSFTITENGILFQNKTGEETGKLSVTENGDIGMFMGSEAGGRTQIKFDGLEVRDSNGDLVGVIEGREGQGMFVSSNQAVAANHARVTIEGDAGFASTKVSLEVQGGPFGQLYALYGGVSELFKATLTEFLAAEGGLHYEQSTNGLTYHNAAGSDILIGDAYADANWIAPTLSNSWVNFDGTKSSAGYRKTARGTVVLKGVLKSGTSATAVMFTLPAGYRPSQTRRYAAAANTAVGIVEVTTGGAVSFVVGGSTTQSSLDGIEIWL
jgi:hypothetical protein